MSGPKDFVILLAAARLAEMMARRAAFEAARQAANRAAREATREGLLKASEAAKGRRAIAAGKARRVSEERFRMLAQKNAERLAAAQGRIDSPTEAKPPKAVAEEMGKIISAAHDGLARLDQAFALEQDSKRIEFEQKLEAIAGATVDDATILRAQTIRDQVLQAADRMEQRSQRLEEATVGLQTWKEILSNDPAVQQFSLEACRQWLEELQSVLTQAPGIDSIDAILERAEALCNNAEDLHKSASDKRVRFDERNELLRDILESLQEVGFFVSDPTYENPNDPLGPVIIKGTRGSEEVSASVDLSDTVRTVWNGVADEKCKNSFFQYVDQMGKRGVEVKPNRADLQSRPILRQAGAKDLPRTSSRNEGV